MTLLLGYAIKSSIVLMVALFGVALLRRRSAASRHALLFAGIVAAATVPLLAIVVPARTIPMPAQVPEFLPPDPAAATPPATTEPYYEVSASPVDEVDEMVAIPQTAHPTDAQAGTFSLDRSQLLLWAWISGVALLVAHLLAGVAQLVVVSRRARVLTEGAWVEIAEEISRRYGLTSRIRLLETSQAVLATWGVFRPKLLVPDGASSWPAERIRIVLHHELAHVRRYDWLVQMFAEALRAFYWFNPLCWVACEKLVQESEQACDDIALSCGIAGTDYAQQLLALTIALKHPKTTLSAAISMARPSTLERRFNALLNPGENRRSVSATSLAVTMAAALTVAGSIASLRLVAEPLLMTLPQPAAPMVPEALHALTSALMTFMPQVPLQSQVPAVPANASAPAGAGSIEGTVVKSGTTEQIPGATVSLQRIPGPGAAVTPPTLIQSGTDGKFAFSNLAPGSYRLVALRADGFVVAEHGQQTFNGRGRPVPLLDGQRLTNVSLAMMPTGSIFGRVFDRDGDPLGRAQVQALQATYREGRRILKIIQSVQTNDVGEYRLFWLPPGPYYITARPEDPRRRNVPLYVAYPGTGGVFEQAAPPVLTHRVLENGTVSEESFVLVYYPGTTEFPSAAPIDLRPGDSLGGINFSVGAGQVQTRHVRGRAIDANGQPLTGNVLAVSRTPHPNATIPSATLGGDGRFDIGGVVPGSYYILAGNPPAIVPIEVGGLDLENVAVVSRPGVELNGRIVIEGKPAIDTDPDVARLQANCPGAATVRCLPIRLNLVAEPALLGFPQEVPAGMPGMAQPGGGIPNGVVLADGMFTFRNLSVREHRLAFTGLPPDWYVRSARLGSLDVISSLVSFPAATTDRLEVVIGTSGGRIEGRVVNATGQPVASATAVLVPEAPNRSRRDFYRSAVTDDAGVFRFQGIAPGDYKVFAWEEIEVSSWLDPAIVRPHESRGKAVRIQAGTRENVEAVVIPAER
ncbi:MAG TPA: M56 family metallopeptidase [Terriglobia bacterium]|nr:M56 family metallopeptidase [Terriglobia bacterium]